MLSLLLPLSLQETSSSDPRNEQHGDDDASTSSNFLFRMPLIMALSTAPTTHTHTVSSVILHLQHTDSSLTTLHRTYNTRRGKGWIRTSVHSMAKRSCDPSRHAPLVAYKVSFPIGPNQSILFFIMEYTNTPNPILPGAGVPRSKAESSEVMTTGPQTLNPTEEGPSSITAQCPMHSSL